MSSLISRQYELLRHEIKLSDADQLTARHMSSTVYPSHVANVESLSKKKIR